MDAKIIQETQRTINLLRFKVQQLKMQEEPDTPLHDYLKDIETHLDQTELDLAAIYDRIHTTQGYTGDKR